MNAVELPPFPDGWYALCLSKELKPGQMLTRTFAGSEVLVFRTSDGKASVVDAYCPHLGAHMGHGGCVKDDTVVCPFHAFRFDRDGKCVATGYGTKPPPKAVLRTWRVLERNGLVMAWHAGDDAAPTWEPPELEWDGWTGLNHEVLDVRSHPQETTENSVDTGHLSVVHGYDAVDILDPLEIDGPYLTSRYTMTRKNPWVPAMPAIENSFRVHVWGLGYSLVEIHTHNFDFHFRLFILPMPRDGENIDLRVAVSLREDFDPKKVSKLLFAAPRRMFGQMLLQQTLNGIVGDVKQDFDMWQNKIYVDPPVLAKGDGPIGPYRRYCRQFYPEFRAQRMAAE